MASEVFKRRHVVTYPEGQDARRRAIHVATCACGWHGRPQAQEWAARQEGEAHQREMLGGDDAA